MYSFLVTLLYLDSIIFSYGLLHRTDHQLAFIMEMLRIILVENIFFKFLVPLFIILLSRRRVQALWAEREARKLEFFQTLPSFIARPVVYKYPTSGQTVQTVQREPVKTRKSGRFSMVTVTMHNFP